MLKIVNLNKIKILMVISALFFSIYNIGIVSADYQRSFRLQGRGNACTPSGDCYMAFNHFRLDVTYSNENSVKGVGIGELFFTDKGETRSIKLNDIEWNFDRSTHVITISSVLKGLYLEGVWTGVQDSNQREIDLTGYIGPVILSYVNTYGLDLQSEKGRES